MPFLLVTGVIDRRDRGLERRMIPGWLIPSRLVGESIADPIAALEGARQHFQEATDFTIGIEEEFQILDPGTLDLAQRYAELRAAADASDLNGYVAGELISSEIEIKTGRCETFAQAAREIRDQRRKLWALADRHEAALGVNGTHPFARWQDQVIIDTPHYRIVEGNLKYVAWRNNTFGIHVHVGIRDADRAMAVANALRSVVPELTAASASSPWLEDRFTHLRSTRTQIFTRMFPRCGIPDAFETWSEYDRFVRFLLDTGSIREHTEIWWTIRPHQSFGTVEIRACDALPDINESIALCAFQVALTARFARLYDEGRPLPILEGRYIEENLWRAIRWGLDRELIDFEAGVSVPASDRIKALLEACGEDADRLGLAPYLAPLERLLEVGDNASQYARRIEAGETPRAVFAEQVERARASIDAVPSGAR
jgi:carboxylate-amine ligase